MLASTPVRISLLLTAQVVFFQENWGPDTIMHPIQTEDVSCGVYVFNKGIPKN